MNAKTPFTLVNSKKIEKMIWAVTKKREAYFYWLSYNNSGPFLYRIVTCVEKLIIYDNRKGTYRWVDAAKQAGHRLEAAVELRKRMASTYEGSN